MDATPALGEKLLKIEEVAAFMRVTKDHVYRLVRSGSIPSVRVGRALRFRSGDIHAYLEPTKEADRGKEQNLTRPRSEAGTHLQDS